MVFNTKSGKSYTTQMGEHTYHYGSCSFDIPACIMQDTKWVFKSKHLIHGKDQESDRFESDEDSASDGSGDTEVPEIKIESGSEYDSADEADRQEYLLYEKNLKKIEALKVTEANKEK